MSSAHARARPRILESILASNFLRNGSAAIAKRVPLRGQPCKTQEVMVKRKVRMPEVFTYCDPTMEEAGESCCEIVKGEDRVVLPVLLV